MLSYPKPNFSLYHLIDPQDVNSIFSERAELLAHWSKMIETAVIEQQLPVQMISGLQHLGRIKPILGRYRKLARIAESVTIIGLQDADVDLTGMHYIALEPESALVQEWILIVRHPHYTRALIAQEDTLNSGTFHGVMTSDPVQVERFYNAITDELAASALKE